MLWDSELSNLECYISAQLYLRLSVLPDAVTKFAISSFAASTGTTEEFAAADTGPIPAIRHSKGFCSSGSRHFADQ